MNIGGSQAIVGGCHVGVNWLSAIAHDDNLVFLADRRGKLKFTVFIRKRIALALQADMVNDLFKLTTDVRDYAVRGLVQSDPLRCQRLAVMRDLTDDLHRRLQADENRFGWKVSVLTASYVGFVSDKSRGSDKNLDSEPILWMD